MFKSLCSHRPHPFLHKDIVFKSPCSHGRNPVSAPLHSFKSSCSHGPHLFLHQDSFKSSCSHRPHPFLHTDTVSKILVHTGRTPVSAPGHSFKSPCSIQKSMKRCSIRSLLTHTTPLFPCSLKFSPTTLLFYFKPPRLQCHSTCFSARMAKGYRSLATVMM